MTAAASAGNVSLSLQTYDASTNLTIVGTVTGINSGETAISIANKIQTQFTTIITQYGGLYNGQPSLVSEGPAASFRITRTDHSLCFFSETAFELLVDSTTGCILNKGSDPTLVTISEARSLGTFLGEPFEDIDGDPYSDAELAALLGILSAKVVAYINNPIVASTYRHDEFPFDRRGVKVPKYPIQSVDPIRVRVGLSFLNWVSSGGPLADYHIEPEGWIIWRYAQEILAAWEPFEYGNGVNFTYVSGEKRIPAVVKEVLVSLVESELLDDDYSSLKGGTFAVTRQGNILKNRLLALTRYAL